MSSQDGHGVLAAGNLMRLVGASHHQQKVSNIDSATPAFSRHIKKRLMLFRHVSLGHEENCSLPLRSKAYLGLLNTKTIHVSGPSGVGQVG